jgi:hypothetical protein
MIIDYLPWSWRLFIAKLGYRLGLRSEAIVWYYELSDRERVRKIGSACWDWRRAREPESERDIH